MSERPFTIKSFNDYLAEGRIMGSQCKSCGKICLPPRPICPDCGGRNLEWTELGGSGAIEAFTIIRVPLTRMKERCPYACSVVRLDDGPSISGLILDVPDLEKIGIGSRVRAEFIKEGNQARLCFRLV